MAAVALTAALMLPPTPYVQVDVEPPCAPGLIHTWGVLCVTEVEFERLWNPAPPVPIPVELVGEPGVEQWRTMVAYYWGKHGATDRMLRIMRCESGGVPTAKNPHSSATGLFQVMGFWQKVWPGDYTDPWTNAAVAYQIWLSQGYGAWACKG